MSSPAHNPQYMQRTEATLMNCRQVLVPICWCVFNVSKYVGLALKFCLFSALDILLTPISELSQNYADFSYGGGMSVHCEAFNCSAVKCAEQYNEQFNSSVVQYRVCGVGKQTGENSCHNRPASITDWYWPIASYTTNIQQNVTSAKRYSI